MSEKSLQFLTTLDATVRDRLKHPVTGSYTATLAAAGGARIAQKVGEEAVELALASVTGGRDEVLNEAADLVYHLLVLLNTRDIELGDVVKTLESRHGK